MEYVIRGTAMPMLEITLDEGETVKSQGGAMKWMDSSVVMKTAVDGGLKGYLKRKFTQEDAFLTFFEASKNGDRVSFGHTFPGQILPVDVSKQSVICQKRSFLCSTANVDLEIAVQKKLSTSFFGGEGFIMQKLTGEGTAFVEIDGECQEIVLEQGQSIKVETGCVAMFESTVSMNIERVKGFKNLLFGGEGLFLTSLTGPGRVWIQSMPIQNMVQEMSQYMPSAPSNSSSSATSSTSRQPLISSKSNDSSGSRLSSRSRLKR